MEKILIVAATKTELPPVNGAIKTGFGKKRTRRTMEKVIENLHPSLVISVGLVGALVPELKVGDIFIPEAIIDYENPGKRYQIRYPINKGGVLVTVPRVFKSKDKYRLKDMIPDAACVDMETSAVAEILEPLDIPLLCIKAVSDELDFDFNDRILLRRNINKAIDSQNKFLSLHLRKSCMNIFA